MALDMNPVVRAQWCTALRSGDYPQTRGALRWIPEEGGKPCYCCLGVLTDLWLKAGHSEMVADHLGSYSVWADTDGVLAPAVKKWAGLSHANPYLDPGNPSSAAGELNDAGATFAQIADLIDGGAS